MPTTSQHRSIAPRLVPRASIAVAFALLACVTALAAGPVEPAGAEGRTIEMTSPVPARGYWLRFDPFIDFSISCLPGETSSLSDTDHFSDVGYLGSGGFGLGISAEAEPGTHEVVVSCVLIEDRSVVMESKTFQIEVGEHTSLVATVGTVPGECATTREITVPAGTEVFWCYTLLPHPDVAGEELFGSWDLVDHVVEDSLNGPLGAFSQDPQVPLGDGLSSVFEGIVSSTVVDSTVTNTGTWYTHLTDMYDEVAEDWGLMPVLTADATVIVEDPDAPEPTDTSEPGSTTTSAPAPVAASPATPVSAQPTYAG